MSTPHRYPGDSATLLRYLRGEASHSERHAAERWLDADRAHRAEFERLRRAWELSATTGSDEWDTSALWRRIEQGMVDRKPETPARPSGRPLILIPDNPRSRWFARPANIAAAAVFVAGTALMLSDRMMPPESTPEPVFRTYTTKPGERAELRLVDGSTVIVGGASTLRIPETFGASARELYLEGEAYFDVAHDTSRPFRVRTPRTVAEDLGTKFVVTAYSADSSERVVVSEGVVALHARDTAGVLVLRARDIGRVSRAGTLTATRNANVERYFGWLNGVAQFDEEPLADAVKVLDRQYGVRIHVADSALARRRFTGSIRSANRYEDLAVLALLIDARFQRIGDEVYLTPAAAPSHPRR